MFTTGRRRRVIARLTIAVAVAITLTAAGCSDGGNETTTDAAASPLAEFLGQGDFLSDPEAAQARWAEEERERQDVIASCMQEQGFEYVPVDYSQFDTFDEEFDDYGSDEWVAEWGFGITTQRFSQQQVGDGLKGWDESRMIEETEDFVDPNQDYVESLGSDGQQAFYEALYGADDFFPEFDESMSEEEQEALFDDIAFEPQGCEGEAYAEDPANQFYQDFGDEMQAMEERLQADPRVEERRREISDCVADRGLEYGEMESIYERFEEDLQTMDPFANGFEPDFGVTEEEMADMSEAELEELFSVPPEMPALSDEDRARLGELQTEEIALAVAVNECGGGFEEEYEMLADIRAEYEQEFLDTYADQLEDYKAG